MICPNCNKPMRCRKTKHRDSYISRVYVCRKCKLRVYSVELMFNSHEERNRHINNYLGEV